MKAEIEVGNIYNNFEENYQQPFSEDEASKKSFNFILDSIDNT